MLPNKTGDAEVIVQSHSKIILMKYYVFIPIPALLGICTYEHIFNMYKCKSGKCCKRADL